MITQSDLDNLKKAYYRGVLRVREGNSWVEYQSLADMRIALQDAEAELSTTKRVKTQYVATSKGYNR